MTRHSWLRIVLIITTIVVDCILWTGLFPTGWCLVGWNPVFALVAGLFLPLSISIPLFWLRPVERFQKNKSLKVSVPVSVLIIIISFVIANATKVTTGSARRTKIIMHGLVNNIELFRTDCGRYPDQLEDLNKKPSYCASWGPEPYVKNIPKDSWGKSFIYKIDKNGFELVSYGADAMPGGTGLNSDISSKQ